MAEIKDGAFLEPGREYKSMSIGSKTFSLCNGNRKVNIKKVTQLHRNESCLPSVAITVSTCSAKRTSLSRTVNMVNMAKIAPAKNAMFLPD